LRQAKPAATYEEILNAITETATTFNTTIVPVGKAINLQAAAEALAGKPVKFVDATPIGIITTTEVVADASIDPASLPKPVISNSAPTSSYILNAKKHYPEGYMQLGLNINDSIGVTSLKTYLVDPTGRQTLVDNPIIPRNPKSFSYNEYLNIPGRAIPGSKWSFLIKVTNLNGTTESNLGEFTILDVPPDKTRPTFDFNSTYQKRANTNSQKPGVAVPIYLNARDDVKIVSASYTVKSPDGSLATFPNVTNGVLSQIADYFTVGSDTFIIRALGTAGQQSVRPVPGRPARPPHVIYLLCCIACWVAAPLITHTPHLSSSGRLLAGETNV
jgi:hypothetical protein